MSVIATRKPRTVEYPTSDGKPMAETDWHRILMTALIQTLEFRFVADSNVYVSGNLLIFYVPGNKRKHVSPDVFVVKGVRKMVRPNYLTWEEGKMPNAIIEVTSRTTRKEDTDTKFVLYRDTLKVREYFLFDPFGDYLKPARLRGYRLRKGEYEPIALVDGRMPSRELGLHLVQMDNTLRLYDPVTTGLLLTPDERAEQEAQRAAQEAQRADKAEREAAAAIQEVERLRRQLEFKKNGH